MPTCCSYIPIFRLLRIAVPCNTSCHRTSTVMESRITSSTQRAQIRHWFLSHRSNSFSAQPGVFRETARTGRGQRRASGFLSARRQEENKLWGGRQNEVCGVVCATFALQWCTCVDLYRTARGKDATVRKFSQYLDMDVCMYVIPLKSSPTLPSGYMQTPYPLSIDHRAFYPFRTHMHKM